MTRPSTDLGQLSTSNATRGLSHPRVGRELRVFISLPVAGGRVGEHAVAAGCPRVIVSGAVGRRSAGLAVA